MKYDQSHKNLGPKRQAARDRFALGIAILETKGMPRTGRTFAEIAAYTGTTRQSVHNISVTASEKLRRGLAEAHLGEVDIREILRMGFSSR